MKRSRSPRLYPVLGGVSIGMKFGDDANEKKEKNHQVMLSWMSQRYSIDRWAAAVGIGVRGRDRGPRSFSTLYTLTLTSSLSNPEKKSDALSDDIEEH